MKRFSYKAVSANGEAVEGEMDAADESVVISKLQQSGYLPVSAHDLSISARRGGASYFSRQRVSSNDLHQITRDLGTMLSAGLPLADALGTLGSLSTRPAVREFIESVRSSVESGDSLSIALTHSNISAPNFMISMIRAGESGGMLELALERLADYQERSREMRDAVLSALLYPAILMMVAGSSLILLLLFVVPQFQPLFEDLGAALPWSTEIVVAIAVLLRNFWWALPILVLICLVAYRTIQLNPDLKIAWHRMGLRIPLMGDLIVQTEVAQLCRTLGTLTANGVALLDAVNLAQGTARNLVFANALGAAAHDLEQGRPFSNALGATDEFPPLTIQLVRVGEETGQLAAMLLRIAEVFEGDTRRSIKRALAIVEPVLILGMGILIAFIILSILLAILGLNELVI